MQWDVLHSLENCQKECFWQCIDVASDVMFECSDIARPDLGTLLIEGHVHGKVPILLGSIKCWLHMNDPDLREHTHLEITFMIRVYIVLKKIA